MGKPCDIIRPESIICLFPFFPSSTPPRSPGGRDDERRLFDYLAKVTPQLQQMCTRETRTAEEIIVSFCQEVSYRFFVLDSGFSVERENPVRTFVCLAHLARIATVHPMKMSKAKKRPWRKPMAREISTYMEVSLYSADA
jgi:hypothetical protein